MLENQPFLTWENALKRNSNVDGKYNTLESGKASDLLVLLGIEYLAVPGGAWPLRLVCTE